jgi:hypothetical protein
MSATSLWPHWAVARAVAMLSAGREHIDPAYLAAELECDEDEAMEVLGVALDYRPAASGCFLYSKAEAH